MGKLNEIQEQTTQSWGDNAFTTSIKVDTVEFDSLKDKFTFKDPVEVPGLKINGTEIATFDAEDKAKLDSLTSTMQVKGRVDDISDLPTEGVSVGDVYLVGLSGNENFEEYVCVELSGSPEAPVWENLGHVKVQSDWNQSNISADNYIKNKPAVKAGQGVDSIVEGSGTTASGPYSHAEGNGTTASEYSSHSEGYATTASGQQSHAEGQQTTASGICSHAEGSFTKATNSNSHAEGQNATASGYQSHAEGQNATASGPTSHAEGNGTTASKEYSHAEGNGATASGPTSHAEGSYTTASGPTSHAEGSYTTASGQSSHAEGGGTTASSSYSHTEGSGTTASGTASHAEGNGTTASGVASHTEGNNTTATGDSSHTEGRGTIANNKSQHVFGEYNGVDPSSALSSARGTYIEIVGNGANSTARSNARTLDWSGNETLSGNLTIGGTITANGQQILPAVPQVQADWGQSDSESPDFVKNKPFYEDILGELVLSDTPPTGVMYFDWGEFVPVVGKSYPIEFDIDNGGILEHQIATVQANADSSPGRIVIYVDGAGPLFYTPTDFSAEGHNVNGKFSGNPNLRNLRLIDSVIQKLDAKFIDGYMVAGTGRNSNKFNSVGTNVASGDYSHAEGDGTKATEKYSHAEGSNTTASGWSSHAEGNGTTASGGQAHAEGFSTTASGGWSHAEGASTTAGGGWSHAEGNGATASGKWSHAEGRETIANHQGQHVFGEYNIADPSLNGPDARGNYVEIVGKGTNGSARSNARTLDWSGNETLSGNLTIGGTITANGQQILPQKQADWNQTTSTESDYIKNKPAIKAGQGVSSIIEGGGTTASGDYSHTEGYSTSASGNYSHAEGGDTTASGSYSHVEGMETTASHRSQHVFGEFNELDPSTALPSARGNYVEIVGNGTSFDTRSNVRTLDWSGNEVLAGTLTIGGTSGVTLKVEGGALKVSFNGGTTWLTVSAS